MAVSRKRKGGEEVDGGRGSDGEKTPGREEAAQGRQHCPRRQQQKVHDYFAGDPNCYTFGASWRTGENRSL